MKNIVLVLTLFLFPFSSFAQSLSSSNLPIVIIDTDNSMQIPDAYKVMGNMKIIYHRDGSRNSLFEMNDTNFLNYNGRIGIEIRGSSSQNLSKKPYGLTTYKADNYTNNNVSIFGMPKENDWVLNSIAFDPSLIRNYLSYDLSRTIGEYSPRCVYCEVIINGSYQGLYIFMEKIKIDPGRVNIVKMTKADNSVPNLTGGYIVKADKTTGGDAVVWSMFSYTGYVEFLHDSPKHLDITSEQSNYIYNQFLSFQNTMTARNSSIVNGYPSIIDIPSFVDFMIINELASNADAYQFSTYFHKDRNGKLRAGPIWDFDLTYGNDLFFWGLDRSHNNVWQFDNGDNTGAKFWKDLYDNPTFKCYLSKRWKELSAENGPLNYTVLSKKIDQIISHISEASMRENNKWGTAFNINLEISYMKSWLQTRVSWLSSYLGNYQACLNPSVPPLVITKINYNPAPAVGLTDNNLEFIEISNNSYQPVNLTGIYFKELGLGFQFPPNSTLAANDRLYLASDPVSFKKVYGVDAFGKFSRNLANDSEKIILADAFGNTIDYIEYQDTIPWPVEADGNGYYLQLKDINLDNSLAENWTYSANIALGIKENLAGESVSIYPNPTRSKVNIESENKTFTSYEVIDLRGRKMIFADGINSGNFTIDFGDLIPDIYILKLTCKNGEMIVQKINKLPVN